MNRARALATWCVIGGLGFAMAACSGETKTSPNNPKRSQITINDLMNSASEIGQSMAADLETLVRYDFGGERVAMFLGDIDNRTGTVSTDDFDVVQREVRAELFDNRFFRENVQLRETNLRLEELNAREGVGASGDPFAEMSDAGIDPAYVFYLNGDARKIDRQDETGFFLEMTLLRASNSEIVWTERYFVQYGGG